MKDWKAFLKKHFKQAIALLLAFVVVISYNLSRSSDRTLRAGGFPGEARVGLDTNTEYGEDDPGTGATQAAPVELVLDELEKTGEQAPAPEKSPQESVGAPVETEEAAPEESGTIEASGRTEEDGAEGESAGTEDSWFYGSSESNGDSGSKEGSASEDGSVSKEDSASEEGSVSKEGSASEDGSVSKEDSAGNEEARETFTPMDDGDSGQVSAETPEESRPAQEQGGQEKALFTMEDEDLEQESADHASAGLSSQEDSSRDRDGRDKTLITMEDEDSGQAPAERAAAGLSSQEEGSRDRDGRNKTLITMEDEDSAGDKSGEARPQGTADTLVFQGPDYTVTASYGEDAGIPAGASLVVFEIKEGTRDYRAYCDQAQAAVAETEGSKTDGEKTDTAADTADAADTEVTVSWVRLFDITIEANGAVIEPQGPVEVRIDYGQAIEQAADEEVSTVHFEGEDEVPVILKTRTEGSDEALEQVTFETEGFSVFAVIGTTITKRILTSDGVDYLVTLTCGPEAAIPADAELEVREIPEDSPIYQTCREKSGALFEADRQVAFARFFDITILKDGREIQPAAPVEVRIEVADRLQEDTRTVHFEQEAGRSTDREEDVQAAEAVLLDTAVVKADRMDSAVTFSASGFSIYGIVYTVDFAYSVDGRRYEFSMNGGETITLSKLIDVLGMVDDTNFADAQAFLAEIAEVMFSDESLVRVSRTEDDWDLESLQAFNTDETLTITMQNGDVVTVQVTDAQIKKYVIDASGNTWEITVTYDDITGIPEDAALLVEEIPDSSDLYDAYVEKTAALLGIGERIPGYIRLFDIKIVDPDDFDVKYQPAEGTSVDVRIELADAESHELNVVHFADEGGQGDVLPSEISTSSGEGDGVTVYFEAAGFSAYAIVEGPSAVPEGWTKITSLDGLKDHAAAGVYIGTTGGYYMTNTTAIGSSDKNTTGIVKTKPAQSYPSDDAARYFFEAEEGADNLYSIYCMDDEGSKRYVRNTGDANLYLAEESEKTVFTILVDNNGRFRFQNGNRYWNMWNGANGNHIACWTAATDGNNYFYLWDYSGDGGDPYGLDEKTYGLMYWIEGTNGKALLSSENETAGHLDALSLTVMSKANDGAKLYVPDNSDITFWTFHHIENSYYYLTAAVDGSTKYLRISSSGLEMVSSPDNDCRIQVTPGEGSHAGQISLTAGGKTLSYSGSIDSGFRTGGTAGSEWLNLVEESELDNTYFMTYSAGKVSVSGESVTNGSRVIVYTRVWNETARKYEFYAIDHDGSLVRCYESGDNIEWVGGRLNSMLWNFMEYYWEGTTDPNGYYELYNQYSEKFIVPQKSSDQILADDPAGINMSGRQNGKYYSPIVAWDDGYYAYAGLKADMTGGKVVSCPIDEANDFYFAIVQDLPVDDELHTVSTVDHTLSGITMKMVNFGTDLCVGNNNDTVRKQMSDYLGSDNGYKNGNTEAGLLATALGEDGYPVTKADKSLSAWFSGAQEVNHLFIESTYRGTGYFEYDSTQNFAHLDQSTNNFTVYRELAASASSGQFHDHGHFWPYNDIEAGKFAVTKNLRDALGKTLPASDPRKYEKLYAVQKSNTAYAPDYYMGMEVTASFTQTPNGLDDWGHDIIYEFTGDDDFWLFVDGELIIDLGGIHDALAGSVNYRTGEVLVNGRQTTLKDLFCDNYVGRGHSEEEAQEYAEDLFEQNSDGQWIFRPYSTHTMKIYYLERGAGASNLHMRFNLASIRPGTAQLTKHLSGVDTAETVLAEFPYQILYRTKDSDGNLTEHYLTNAVAKDAGRMKDYVFYRDTETPVTYRTEYTVGGKTYHDVFILKPEETADINFPLETFAEGTDLVDYKIIECGVNTAVYTGVTVNGASADGAEVTDDSGKTIAGRRDYATDYAGTDARGRVVYDNAVSPDALTFLTVTKKLYDVTGNTEITEETDKTVFDFRLYLATESGDIDSSPAGMHTYHVKDTDGNYCKWDTDQQRIVPLGSGKTAFSDLSETEREAATFHTSLNGSISKIPAGYTIEVRDLLIGTKFKLVERPGEIPDGYSFKKYVYENAEHTSAAAGVSDTIDSPAGAHVEVDNAKGFGLRVNKTWVDQDYMSDRDAAYFGIFYQSGTEDAPDWKLVEGSLRRLPWGASSVYWYYDQLPVAGGTDFSKYVIYEVSLTDADADEEGQVTSYGSLKRLNEGETIALNGRQIGDTEPSAFTYTVAYHRGELSANSNVRVDAVTNSRPGIILKKAKWDGETALAGARFTLKDSEGHTIGTYTSAEDGLITEAFLRKNVPYTLTETSSPQGWQGLETAMTIELTNTGVLITDVDESCYTAKQDTETEKITITVKNRPYTFRAIKIDAGTGGPLEGVRWKLYRQITVDNVQAWDPNPYPGYENLVSDDSGLIFSADGLPAGTYQLRESAPLPGYQALSGHITFTVSGTGSVSLAENHPDEASLSQETQEDGSLLYTLTLINSRILKVSVWKTDAGYYTLTGAAFSLYRAADYDAVSDRPLEDAKAILTGSVGENGLLSLGALTVGEYYLVETEAPEGYTKAPTAIRITVKNTRVTAYLDGAPCMVSTADGENARHWVSGQDEDTWQIRVPNSSGYALPSTGGPGRGVFTTPGILLIILMFGAGVMLWRRHKRSISCRRNIRLY